MTHFALNRRGFLASSAASGLSLPLAAQATSSAAASAPVVGVYLPPSGRYPTLAREYRAGLELALERTGHGHTELVPIATGSGPHKLVNQTLALLAQRRVNLLTGYIGTAAVHQLAPRLLEQGTALLASDSGAHRISSAKESPAVARHSLEYWQSSALLGAMAPARLGHKAVVCMGFLESGYDFPGEFARHFAATGGLVVGRHVSGVPQAEAEFAGLEQTVRTANADFVLALYSGNQASRFHKAYRLAGLHRIAPLVGLPFTRGLGEGVDLDVPIASWAPQSEECAAIAPQCRRIGLPLTGPALLGYEAGLQIGQAFSALGPRAGGDALVEYLRRNPVRGPRGERRYDAQVADSCGPHWVQACSAAPASRVGWLGNPSPFLPVAANRARSGWINPYLIT